MPVKKNDKAKMARRRAYSIPVGGRAVGMWRAEEREVERVDASLVVTEAVVNLANMALRAAKRPEERAMACHGVLVKGEAIAIVLGVTLSK